jgi:hypothetical protein
VPLLEATRLKNLLIINARHMNIINFNCLKKHKTLQRVRIGLGSDKKNVRVKQLLNLEEALSPYDPLIRW